MIEITRGGKNPLTLANPVMAAAGTVGFDGAAYRDLLDLSKLGALVTNPITWQPRRVARGTRVVPLPAGVLVHTGLPNPGIRQVVTRYRERWARSLTPIIVHVMATMPTEVAQCVATLEGCVGVIGVEIGVHDQATPAEIGPLVEAALSHTQLPVLVRVPLYSALETARAAAEAGAGGVVVAAPPRGTARAPQSGQLVGGRVYGPWLKAQALRAVGQVARLVDVPVTGCGGIHSPDDARDFLEAGAVAVQVDTVTWVQPRMLEIIARNLGGLELTRVAGALPDEWQPGMGETMRMRQKRRAAPPPTAEVPPTPPDLPE
ncbi:MAG: HisA/HisF-related TIM barrel protein [Aggregatilineaceae bacterium]